MSPVSGAPPPLVLDHIGLRRDATVVLDDVSLVVDPGQRWLVLGANGSGKTSLLRIAALYLHPTSGTVDVLGRRLGLVDAREVRRSIGYASAALAEDLRPALTALDAVRTARFAALEPWWHRYDAADDARAGACLDQMGVGHFADRPIGSLSSGERQRVLLARTLMNEPGIILLDEPSAGLDLGGREQLIVALDEMARRPEAPPSVLVTHHVDDIPPSTTHVLLLRAGKVLAAGPIEATLSATSISATFGVDLVLRRRHDGRFGAWAR